MKKFLRSTWFVAVLALVLGLGTQVVVFALKLRQPPPEEAAHQPVVVPDKIVWSFLTPEIDNLRKELNDRLADVAKREQDLNEYEKRLQSERAEIEKIKRDVEGTRDELTASITEIESAEQKNLKTLAATYSNVSPAAALAIFRKMDDDMIVKILTFMKPEPVGQLLEQMALTKDGEGTLAERAAVISNKLRLVHQVKTAANSQS